MTQQHAAEEKSLRHSSMTSEQRIAKRVVVRRQTEELMDSLRQGEEWITCGCGRRQSVVVFYKCYFCSEWYCPSCAPLHFGMTRKEWEGSQDSGEQYLPMTDS